MHNKTAPETSQYIFKLISLLRNNSTGKQTRLLQRKRIKRITGCLKRFNRIELTMYIHIPAVKYYFEFINPFQCNLDRFFPVKKYCHI